MRKISFLILVSVSMLLLIAGCGKKEPPQQPEEKSVPVEVAEVGKADLKKELELTGEIIASTEVDIIPNITGAAKVATVNVKVGQSVKKGSVLFTLDKTDFENNLRNARATLAISGATLESDKKALERSKQLFANNAIPLVEYEAAQTKVKISQGQYEQAQVAVDIAQKNVNETTVTSPATGKISYLNVDVGEMVNSQVPAVTVVRLNPVKVKLNLSENVVGLVSVGQPVNVTIDALGKTIAGKVGSISPQIDNKTRAFPVEVEIPNPDGKILAGMVAKIKLSTGTSKGVIVVPADAVIKHNGESRVFLVKDGVAKERKVTTGVTSDDKVEILKGLETGEQIIVTGNRLVGDGQKVQVIQTVESTGGEKQ